MRTKLLLIRVILLPNTCDMKILFILNTFYATGNGLSASARRTVEALKAAGQDVRIVAGPNDDPNGPQPYYRLKWYHFPLVQPIIDAHGYHFASTDKKILEEAIRWADVVHMEEPFVLEVNAYKIAKKLGKPVTGTYHLHPENVFSSLWLGWCKTANFLLLNAWRDLAFNDWSHIQCPTQNVCDRLVRHHFKSKLHVFSNGLVPDASIRPDVPPEDYLDPQRPLKVVYIGRLSEEKDQPTLIRAIRHSDFAHRIQLQFAGHGPKEKQYKRMAMKLYEDGVVKYKPEFLFCTRDELRALAAGADLCIHCATTEVEGLSIMEALQQGAVPVIAKGRYTGAYQFALDNRSIFREKDDKELAEKIDWWLSHPQERWEEGQRYVKSMEQYNIANSAQALIKMYEEAIAEAK